MKSTRMVLEPSTLKVLNLNTYFFFKLIDLIFIENFTEFMEMMVTVLNQFKIKSFNYFNFADWLNGIQSSR